MSPIAIAIGLLVLLALLPLAPSVLIYKIFPNTVVTTQGILSGIKLNASGAFAAYIAVFLVLVPFTSRCYTDIEALILPTWQISGSVNLIDDQHRQIQLRKDTPLQVTLTPGIIDVARNSFKVRVPTTLSGFPMITLSVGDLGSQVINLDDEGSSAQRNDRLRTIRLTKPIEIQMVAAANYSPNGPAPVALKPTSVSAGIPSPNNP